MQKLNYVLILFGAILFLTSCEKNNENPVVPGEEGFFIINEGGFGNSNTSISYFDRTENKVQNYLFAINNSRSLGDQAQSATVFNDKNYIVVQGSAKIEVTDVSSVKSLATITEGINSPRYFIGINSAKGYISDWGKTGTDGKIKILDLSSNMVTDSIEVGIGTNKMVLVNDKVYALNSGGWASDNTVKIIDPATNKITKSITLGDNPFEIEVDKDGNLWIVSPGQLAYNPDWTVNESLSTAGFIAKLDQDGNILKKIEFDNKGKGSKKMAINKARDIVYFKYNDGIYAMGINDDAVPANALIEGSYYGIGVDSFNDNIVLLEAVDYTNPGTMYFYSPEGNKIATHEVGIGPSSITLK